MIEFTITIKEDPPGHVAFHCTGKGEPGDVTAYERQEADAFFRVVRKYAEFLVETEHEAGLAAMTQEEKDEAMKRDAQLIVEIIEESNAKLKGGDQ